MAPGNNDICSGAPRPGWGTVQTPPASHPGVRGHRPPPVGATAPGAKDTVTREGAAGSRQGDPWPLARGPGFGMTTPPRTSEGHCGSLPVPPTWRTPHLETWFPHLTVGRHGAKGKPFLPACARPPLGPQGAGRLVPKPPKWRSRARSGCRAGGPDVSKAPQDGPGVEPRFSYSDRSRWPWGDNGHFLR